MALGVAVKMDNAPPKSQERYQLFSLMIEMLILFTDFHTFPLNACSESLAKLHPLVDNFEYV